MIPLRSSQPVARFPWPVLALIGLWAGLHSLSYLWQGERVDFLMRVAFRPTHDWISYGTATLFHAHLWDLFVSMIFAWAFLPRLIERRSAWIVFVVSAAGVVLALNSFEALHPGSIAPVLAAPAFLGSALGMAMRREIWGSTSTVVIGPGWIRLYDVPSYVLLFFWLFYLMIGNLFLDPPFADAPMLYWLPFISFLWGFLAETGLGLLLKEK
jgi:hypothetical protein